eukprot:7387067-Prymnesium_polylepis.1
MYTLGIHPPHHCCPLLQRQLSASCRLPPPPDHPASCSSSRLSLDRQKSCLRKARRRSHRRIRCRPSQHRSRPARFRISAAQQLVNQIELILGRQVNLQPRLQLEAITLDAEGTSTADVGASTLSVLMRASCSAPWTAWATSRSRGVDCCVGG